MQKASGSSTAPLGESVAEQQTFIFIHMCTSKITHQMIMTTWKKVCVYTRRKQQKNGEIQLVFFPWGLFR